MFEEMLENAKRRVEESKAEEAILDIIAGMMMKSPSLSASRKNAVALGMAAKSLQNAVHEVYNHCAMRDLNRYSDEDIKKLKQATEYVGMVETRIREYIKTLSFDAPKMEVRL